MICVKIFDFRHFNLDNYINILNFFDSQKNTKHQFVNLEN